MKVICVLIKTTILKGTRFHDFYYNGYKGLLRNEQNLTSEQKTFYCSILLEIYNKTNGSIPDTFSGFLDVCKAISIAIVIPEVNSKPKKAETSNEFLVPIDEEFSKEVNALISVINGIQLGQETELQKPIKALLQLCSELRNFVDKFSHDLPWNLKVEAQSYNQALVKLKNECRATIFSHQNDIMVAPGIWNRIKGYISKLLEKYCDYKPEWLQVKESAFKQSTLSNHKLAKQLFFSARDFAKNHKVNKEKLNTELLQAPGGPVQ